MNPSILIRILVDMIISKKLKVRIYTKGRLHAKAYIFDYKPGYVTGTSYCRFIQSHFGRLNEQCRIERCCFRQRQSGATPKLVRGVVGRIRGF